MSPDPLDPPQPLEPPTWRKRVVAACHCLRGHGVIFSVGITGEGRDPITLSVPKDRGWYLDYSAVGPDGTAASLERQTPDGPLTINTHGTSNRDVDV